MDRDVHGMGAILHHLRIDSEALQDMFNCILLIMANMLRPWASFNGHYPYQHYAAEMGFDAIGSEIGENIHNYQLQLALIEARLANMINLGSSMSCLGIVEELRIIPLVNHGVRPVDPTMGIP